MLFWRKEERILIKFKIIRVQNNGQNLEEKMAVMENG
jgi:hypothetical protein